MHNKSKFLFVTYTNIFTNYPFYREFRSFKQDLKIVIIAIQHDYCNKKLFYMWTDDQNKIYLF